MPEQSLRGVVRLGIGIAVPLAMLGATYALWAISDRAGYIGPLDKAKFGWLVVLPLLTATPVATGLAWRSLTTGRFWIAVLSVAGIVAIVAGVIYALALAGSTQGCQYGTRLSGGDVGFAAGLTGIVTGGGYAASGAISAVLLDQRRLAIGTLAGVAGGFATFWAAALAGFAAVGGGGICNRPPL